MNTLPTNLGSPKLTRQASTHSPLSGDMLSGLSLEDAILHNAIKKTSNPLDKSFFLGVMAGVWVGFGGIAGLSVAGGIPVSVRNDWPFLPKLAIALFFPFALHLILMFGGELFTGNIMILGVGLLNRVISPRRVLLNLITVYLGNWSGCLLTAYFFGYKTEIFAHEPYTSYLQSFTISKIEGHGWGVLFLRAIPANTLVCMAVVLALAARDTAGKIMAAYFPVILFVVSSFEHCVANMFFISVGLMYGAPSTIARLWFNQSAAVLGNIVGGFLIIACSEHSMNHWQSLLPAVLGEGDFGKEEGTLAAHDVESTRRAQDFAGHQEADDGKEVMRQRLRERSGSLGSVRKDILPRRRTLT
ncbi:hypothetical protein BD410DRAFT_763442 [Rickenella mellea]|uniref:Formate/nitrite transporter n=1 Tax=Rickenella mellea TaxID=50990 RepID=A0A4Y7QI51_9AGAM|nr:hypothetical protein BD410DRAFT_763442 [Rickenella mellea]